MLFSSSSTAVTPSQSPAPTEASRTTQASTPPRQRGPAYTVVNTAAGIRTLLDVAVKNMSIPPKLYSKAHVLRNTTITVSRTFSRSWVLSEPMQPPPPSLFNPISTTPELYVDAEGISLSRTGELSILILHIETRGFSHTYLVHVHALGRPTFTTKDSSGIHSLKTLFEDNRLPKVLFDCRMDSDALFGQFGVLLAGVIDLQLMCIASRGGGGRGLPGLESCLLQDLDIGEEEKAWVKEAKARGQSIWRPRCGGSMERFNDEPLHEDLVNYCVVDAAYLPRLFETYNAALGNRMSLQSVDVLWGNEDLESLEYGVYSWECRVLQLSKTRAEKALDPYFSGGTGYNPWCLYDFDDDY